MKTLLITSDYLPSLGGVATYYSQLIKHWPKEESIEVLDNSKNSIISDRSILAWLVGIKTVFKLVKKKKFDYLIAGQILPIGTICYLLKFFLKKPYAVVIHGMDFKLAILRKRKKYISKKVLQQADKIICGNTYTANLVKDFLGEKFTHRIKVVNPAIDILEPEKYNFEDFEINKLRDKHSLTNKTVLFSLGRLVERKGFDNVLRALQAEQKQFNNLVYVIAGTGEYKEELKALVKKSKVRVIFLGELDTKLKWLWLNLCDIFIMPAREIKGDFEGFGIVYLEANILEKPVIAGKSGGVKDAVEDGVNGLMVDPENIEDIARAIIRLESSTLLRRKLGQRGRERAIKSFNWQNQAKIFCNYLEEKN